MSTAVVGPPGVDVEYPEGPPMPEGDLQTRRRGELVCALRHWLADRPGCADAWVLNDINVYYAEGDPRVVVAPDVAVSFGVNVAAVDGQRTYRVWDAGAAPVFALEIASHTTVDVDLYDKPARYAELGAQEYWRLDPTGGELLEPPLQGEYRRSGRWEPIRIICNADGTLTGHSSALGLDLHWQPPKLRLYDPAGGAWLLDQDDLLEANRVEAAARRAAEGRAEVAAAARRAAEGRAEVAEAELAALRRQLGCHSPPA